MQCQVLLSSRAEILLSSETEQQQPAGRYDDGYKAVLLYNSEEEVS